MTPHISRQSASIGLWALLIASESLAQIAMKVGSDRLDSLPLGMAWLRAAVSSPGVLIAVGCYVCSFFFWMLILRLTPLSKAFALSSAVFVAVLLASWLGLGEHISGLHWLGALVIVVGIGVLGESGQGADHPAP